MTQTTDTDLQELKDLIKGLDQKIDLGFLEVKGELNLVNTRLTLVETSITKLDNRLWTFIGVLFTATLGSLLTVFARFMFTTNPNL
jgi:hypothetical protein